MVTVEEQHRRETNAREAHIYETYVKLFLLDWIIIWLSRMKNNNRNQQNECVQIENVCMSTCSEYKENTHL